MKELSIEEKAKRYDEAMHKAKRIIDVCVDDNTECRSMIACIQQIFPELKESGEERISEEIIDYFKSLLVRSSKEEFNDFINNKFKRYIAWLEKQGKKTKPVEDFNTEFERQVSCLIASAMNKDYEYTKDFVKWTSDALLNYAKLEIEKNSMGISEATKKKLEDNLNKALEKETPESWNKFLEKQGESYTKRDVDDAYVEGMALAKNELEKQGNSPIKWNKNTNDNKPQKNHSVLIKTTHGIAEGEWQGEQWFQYRWTSIIRDSDVLSWIELSDLEKQGEQKPAWSEEDEDILNTIINHFKVDIECTDEDDIVRWLKSLKERYTWKPSEEQMDALYTYIYNPQYFNSQDPRMELVESVYQDLKKLMEE